MSTYIAFSVNVAFIKDSFDSVLKALKHRDDEVHFDSALY